MKFGAHGEFNLWVEDNIAFIEVSGAWNVETAKDYIYQLNHVIGPQLTKPYGTVGIMHDDWFPTADAIPYLYRATELAIEQGMRKEAFVTRSALSASVVSQLVLPANSDVYEKRQFENLQDAIAWVKE